ncbi:MAG: hypothetical protein KA163_03915 [Bacteroidia bacterium]|nr:hypothetical protein [Bacteroidia bacterium]
MKSKLLFLSAVIIFIASCKTGNNFTSRRYTAGHYKANHSSVKKPEAIASKPSDISVKKEKLTAVYETKETSVLIAANTSKQVVFTEKKHKPININSTSKKTKAIALKKALDFLNPLKQKKSEPLKAGKGEEGISTKSLVGFACGVAGIAIDIITFVVAISALEYIVLLGMILGLILGILGIVFGTQGIKDYRNNKNTPTLVFGIVGAATGLIAIILAVYLGIYGALWITAYGI